MYQLSRAAILRSCLRKSSQQTMGFWNGTFGPQGNKEFWGNMENFDNQRHPNLQNNPWVRSKNNGMEMNNFGQNHRGRNPWQGWANEDMQRSYSSDGTRNQINCNKQITESTYNANPLRVLTPRSVPIETENGFISSSYAIHIDVQGINPEDIRLGLREGKLRIAANKFTTIEDGSKLTESFAREYGLPANVDESSVKSYLKNDVLTLEAKLIKKEGIQEIPSVKPGKPTADERNERRA